MKEHISVPEDVKALIERADAFVQGAPVKIATPAKYTEAAEGLKIVKTRITELTKKRLEMTRPLDSTKKQIMDLFRRPISLYEKAEHTIKQAMRDYTQEEDRKRREEEAKLEAKRKKEEERKRAKLLKKAETAEAQGNQEAAEEYKAEAEDVHVPRAIVETNVPDVAGVKMMTIWKYRIVNAKALPKEYMIPNEKMLGDVARATKGTLAIPGVVFYSEEVVAAGKAV